MVLKAATAVFLQHGFSAATTDMIQQAARVSKSTIYAFFPTKEALFTAVIERECASMNNTVNTLTSTDSDITKTLMDLGKSYLHMVLSSAGLALLRTAVAEGPRFPELARTFYLAGPKAMATLIANKLSIAVNASEINVQYVGLENAANLFTSMLRGEGQMEFMTHPLTQPSEVQIERWVKLAVFTFLKAFSTRPQQDTLNTLL